MGRWSEVFIARSHGCPLTQRPTAMRVWHVRVVLVLTCSACQLSPSILAAQGPAATEVLAVVNGRTITRADVERRISDTLSRLDEQAHKLRRQEVDRLIDEALLSAEAEQRGVTVAQLLQREVRDQLVPATSDEIAAFVERSSLIEGRALSPAEAQRTIEQRAGAARQRELLASLRKDAAIKVLLDPPIVPRVHVAIEGAASRGAPTAAVTIVQFSDYYCHFCQSAALVLQEIERTYGDRVRVVYRHLPIETLHPHARAAAEAAWCAHRQGKFAAFHESAFQSPSQSAPFDLTALARRANLDDVAFETCRASVETKHAVQRDIDEAIRLGVTGTPVFFVNGRRVVGACRPRCLHESSTRSFVRLLGRKA